MSAHAGDGVTGKGKNVNLGSEGNDDFTEETGKSGNERAGEGGGVNAALNTEVEMGTSSQRSGAEEDISGDILPQRLFATDRYPARGRINSYSKSERILKLAELLHGSREWDWILASCFAPVFELPVRMSSFSGKLVHQILCRSLVTAKKHELWFVFGGHPIRFSLQEFGIITRLKCGPLPPHVEPTTNHFASIVGTGPDNSYTIDEIMNMLKRDKRLPEGHEEKMDWMRRLRLALIVIVDGILICDTSVLRATRNTAEMVYDLDAFEKHPWGRVSFMRLLEMVKVGTEVENVGELVEKFKQSHTATHGFTLALQLFILKAVPKLQNHLPQLYDDDVTFTSISVVSLTQLKTFHNANILQTEMDPQLVVQSILQSEDPSLLEQDYSWDDEEDDAAVDVVLNKINEGYIFKKDIWQGGFSEEPLITSCLSAHNKPKTTKARVSKYGKDSKPSKGSKAPKSSTGPTVLEVTERGKSKEKQTSKSKGKGNAKSVEGGPSGFDGSTRAEILAEVDRKNNVLRADVEQKINQVLLEVRRMNEIEKALIRDEIVDDVLAGLRGKGVFKTSDGEELEADIRAHMKEKSSYNTQCLRNTDLRQETMDQVFDRAGIADILSNLKGSLSDPNVGVTDFEAEVSAADIVHLDELKADKVIEPTEDILRDGGDAMPEDALTLREDHVRTYDSVDDGEGMNEEGNVSVEEQIKKPILEDGVAEHVEVHGSDEVDESVTVKGNTGVNESGAGQVVGEEKGGDGGDKGGENGGGQSDVGGLAEPSVKEKKPVPGKKRKDPVAGQELEHLPAKRTRVNNRYYGNTYGLTRKKGKAAVGDAKKTTTRDVLDAAENKGAAVALKKDNVDDGDAQKQGEGVGGVHVPIYMPFGIVQPTIKEKFLANLKSYSGDAYIIEGQAVGRDFFEQLYKPRNWVGTTHMEAMLNTMWKTLGDKFVKSRISVLDTWFTQTLCNEFAIFEKTAEKDKENFVWNKRFQTYVRGKVFNRPTSLGWFTDVDTVYAPMHWGVGHWVAVVIKLREAKILILDPRIVKHDDRKVPQLMKPLLSMLPVFCRKYPKPNIVDCPLPESFTFERVVDVYQNERTGDCGPLAVKFIELHAQGIELDTLTDAMVDEIRLKFAVNVYEDCVQSLRA